MFLIQSQTVHQIDTFSLEIIFANLKTALSRQSETEKEDRNDELSQFCGKWQDDRDAEEIVSQIYADRAKNVRSEKAAL